MATLCQRALMCRCSLECCVHAFCAPVHTAHTSDARPLMMTSHAQPEANTGAQPSGTEHQAAHNTSSSHTSTAAPP